MTTNRTVVKIGSNVLTRADGTLDVTRLSAITDQVAALRRASMQIVLVSSGAVASGRGELRNLPHKDKLDSLSARQLFSAVGQAKLINRYYELFREHGLHCGQVLATKENFDRRGHYLNQQHCMETMLAAGVIPIVNENDTVSVTELMFTDNDELSGLITTMIGAQRLVILSNIDGLFTGNPSDADSVLIPELQPGEDPSAWISSNKSSLGRGGMSSKCRIARRVAAGGTEVIIANGKRENILTDLLIECADVPHTVFRPAVKETSRLKKWIAHSESFAKGIVEVNRGAADALRQGGNSLLPIGVINVNGDFDTDDIVKVVFDGKVIAWGKSGFDSKEIRAIIGHSGERPVIHADYLYVDDF